MTTQRPRPYKISLVGDDCIDEYQYGTVNRLSPEAPVPVLNYTRTVRLPGMAANVKANLEALGCEVEFHTREPSRKIRLIDEKSKHHITRIDHDVIAHPIDASEVFLYCEAIVISDYNKGVVNAMLPQKLRSFFKGPIFVDTKKPDLKLFDGCYVKINELEYSQRTSNVDNLIVTRGSDPVLFFPPGCNGVAEEFEVPQVGAFDVCGAGDTFLAALSYRFIVTRDIRDAIRFAIKAASVTVQHIGVYAPTKEEIDAA